MSDEKRDSGDRPDDPEKVSCEVCRAEIPKAAALHAEGQNYAYHFCGAACFEHWAEEHATEPGKS